MKKSRLAAVAALALASGLVLTACSSSDDDTAAEPAASEAAAVEADADDMAEDAEMADEAPASAGTIVDIAAGTDGFATLVAAADAAGLIETLSGEGPFTVFAPTDDAFAALPEGLVDGLDCSDRYASTFRPTNRIAPKNHPLFMFRPRHSDPFQIDNFQA